MQPHLIVKRLWIMKNLLTCSVLFLAALVLFSCNKSENMGPQPCTGVEPVRLISFQVVDGFFPMHSRYYWLYNDTLFDLEGNVESTTVRMLSAKEGYTHSFREPKSPILVTFSSILPDMAFRNDTVFLLSSRNNLHKRNCIDIDFPFLYPTTDTVIIANTDSLMPLAREVVTPAGPYNDNYIFKGSLFTFLFSREVGLLHLGVKQVHPTTGEVSMKRSVWLKEAVMDPSLGRLAQ